METVASVDELDAPVDVEEEEEKEEFMDEFSDNDNFESDEYSNKDDY